MLFTYAYLLVFVTMVFGSPLEPYHGKAQLERRDFKTISDIMLGLAKQLDDLTSKAKAFDGEPERALPLLEGSENVQKSIESGTATISSTSAMG